MIAFLLLLCAGDAFTSFQGFEARSDALAQVSSDRNARHAAATEALPKVDADLAVWKSRFDAMQAGLSIDATSADIFAAQGHLILCVPGAYSERPDGRMGPNTLSGMRQCAERANGYADTLGAERARLQAIIEEGADNGKHGTTFWERIGIASSLIFFSNVLAIMAGAWISRARQVADEAEMVSEIDARTADLNNMSKFMDEMIQRIAA